MTQAIDSTDSPATSRPRSRRWALKTLLVLAVLIGAFLAYVALQSPNFRVERSITINAPAEVVFEQVNDLRKWEAWSPWAKLDPNARYEYSGPASGAGTSLAWAGNSDVGEGRMTITESIPARQIRMQLDFIKPMEATNLTEFNFTQQDQQTTVQWVMSGQNSFIGRLVCTVMNMDKMLGDQFEKGLAQMKQVAERAAQQ